MPSAIDVTKPGEGEAYTADVRGNFQTAANEISALQDAVAGPASGTTTLGTAPTVMSMTVGSGVPGGATVGFDQPGSQYTDIAGAAGAFLYLSNGDGTWTAIG
jgi:hypothetical protein